MKKLLFLLTICFNVIGGELSSTKIVPYYYEEVTTPAGYKISYMDDGNRIRIEECREDVDFAAYDRRDGEYYSLASFMQYFKFNMSPETSERMFNQAKKDFYRLKKEYDQAKK